MKSIVLVYSGGLDTSVCIPMLREEYGYDRLVTVTVDVGQPADDVRQAEEKAKALGTEHATIDAKRRGVPISQTTEKIWSIDENLWGRSIEGGRLEEPDFTPPEEIFQWTASLATAPPEPRELTVGFENGVPVRLDGQAMDGLDLVRTLNDIAGGHGVGRVDIMEG